MEEAKIHELSSHFDMYIEMLQKRPMFQQASGCMKVGFVGQFGVLSM